MNREIDLIGIMENNDNEEAIDQCLICREDDSDVFEKHHVFGRNNSDLVITLCKSCHAMITADQNKVPRKFRSKNASHQDKINYQLVSVSALLWEIAKQLNKIGHEREYNV